MGRRDFWIVTLVFIAWVLEYSWEVFPENKIIAPFLLQGDETISYRWYILLISYHLKFIVLSICVYLARKKIHFVTREIVKLNILVVATSFLWVILCKNNPFSIPELYLKIGVVVIIYLVMIYSRGFSNNNNNNSDRY